jgi:hypothetical protein
MDDELLRELERREAQAPGRASTTCGSDGRRDQLVFTSTALNPFATALKGERA